MKEVHGKTLPQKWLVAAVTGSLWATVEIVLGSLLHNLRVPFAGSTLSFLTVFLVISFFRVWGTHGLIWRAGLICALMKSISPSAIILGPMIGILSQALILDLTIRLAGKNTFAYALGGALAVFSALVQKALTLLVLYGWGFVELLENLYGFAAGQLGLENSQPAHALAVLALIYLGSGAVAGLLGSRAGNKFLKASRASAMPADILVEGKGELFSHGRTGYSFVFLLTSFALLISGMFIIQRANLGWALLFAAVFTTLVALRYPGNMRYMRKPGLWVQFGVIVFLSALFKNGLQHPLSAEGLLAGLTMCLRALMVLSGFAAISAELKNPVIKNLLYNQGLRSLYQSVDLAFSVLPDMMKEFSARSRSLLAFGKLIQSMLSSTQGLLDALIMGERIQMPVFVLTGGVNQGKTSLAQAVVARLQKEGLHVKGFFSLANNHGQSKENYFIKDIGTGTETPLCSAQSAKGMAKAGRFYFEEKGLRAGHNIIMECLNNPADLLVVDELGPLEMEGKGWAAAIEKLLENRPPPQLWVVREGLVKEVIRKWTLTDVSVFRSGQDTAESIVSSILDRLEFHGSLAFKRQ